MRWWGLLVLVAFGALSGCCCLSDEAKQKIEADCLKDCRSTCGTGDDAFSKGCRDGCEQSCRH